MRYGIISKQRVVNRNQWAAELGNEFEMEGGAENQGQVRELLDFLALTSSFEGFATRPTAASYS